MADIEADRAWMRRRSIEAKAEDEAAYAERQRQYAEQEARTCPYCFHERHEYRMASWSWSGMPDDPGVMDSPISVSVLYCQADGCLCGVYPCGQCGSRTRAAVEIVTGEQCADCGHEWLVSPIA